MKNDVEETETGFKESLTPKVTEGKKKIPGSLKPATFKGKQRKNTWKQCNNFCRHVIMNYECDLFTTLDPM